LGRKGLNTEISGTDEAITSQGGRCQAIYAWLRLFPSVCGKKIDGLFDGVSVWREREREYLKI
jgi:ABC-type amino acid transport substrate-binding protein